MDRISDASLSRTHVIFLASSAVAQWTVSREVLLGHVSQGHGSPPKNSMARCVKQA